MVYSQIGRGIPIIENVDGVLLVDGFDDVIVKINGEYIFLKSKESNWRKEVTFNEYYNDDLNIKAFNMISKIYYESSLYQGFIIVDYKGTKELIFTTMIL